MEIFYELLKFNIELLLTTIESEINNITKKPWFNLQEFSKEIIADFTAAMQIFLMSEIRDMRINFFENLDVEVSSRIKAELLSNPELIYMAEHDNSYVKNNKINYNRIQPIINEIYIDNIEDISIAEYFENSENFDIDYAKDLVSSLVLSEEYIKIAIKFNEAYKELRDDDTLKIITKISNKINYGINNISYENIFQNIFNEESKIKADFFIYALWLAHKANEYFYKNIKSLQTDNLTQDLCEKIISDTINTMQCKDITREDINAIDLCFRSRCIEAFLECSSSSSSSSSQLNTSHNLYPSKRMRNFPS